MEASKIEMLNRKIAQSRQVIGEAIDRYGPGGNVAIMCAIAHPAVSFRDAMPLLHDEIIRYGTGYYC